MVPVEIMERRRSTITAEEADRIAIERIRHHCDLQGATHIKDGNLCREEDRAGGHSSWEMQTIRPATLNHAALAVLFRLKTKPVPAKIVLGQSGLIGLFQRKKKKSPTITVGASAPSARPSGETPSRKYPERIDCPAGFGALAITVRPPPVTAPATTAYFNPSVKCGASVAK